MLRFDVFGTPMSVLRKEGEWWLFRDSDTGARARVYEVVIPPQLTEAELGRYLDDVFHERASPRHPSVRRL
ncbi:MULTISPECIES: hypothetical protein [Ferrimonas]|uniref:DUF7661 family protein n=1 Tax=Ferrimonas TaxID=44011 RepID=UPI0004802F79|nr:MULTISPECIES: hypothetical protein [Ferrimonas]USD36621.1 hypothetical protein J8Z22_16620 [Ferrimonas sp. SCSIO 43195]